MGDLDKVNLEVDCVQTTPNSLLSCVKQGIGVVCTQANLEGEHRHLEGHGFDSRWGAVFFFVTLVAHNTPREA